MDTNVTWQPEQTACGPGRRLGVWRGMLSGVCQAVAWTAVVAMIVITPWCYGGILPELQRWLLWAVGGGVFACGVQLFLANARLERPPVAWGLCVVLGLGFAWGQIQLVPLSAETLRRLSPQAARWRQDLPAVALPSAVGATGGQNAGPADVEQDDHRFPLSLVPEATRHDLGLLALAGGVFWIAQLSIQRARDRFWLCLALTANGVLFTIFGIAQQLTWNGRLFWRIVLPEGAVPFAGYVNRNNAAGYLNMCLGAAVGLLVWSLTRHRFNVVHRSRHDSTRRPPSRPVAISEWLAHLDAWGIGLLAATVCLCGGLVCAGSRGGIVAAAVAGVVATARVIRSRRLAFFGTAVSAVAIVACVFGFWLSGTTQLPQRFTRLVAAGGLEADGRWQHWQDGRRAAHDFQRTGSGLGTYRYVYQPYEKRWENRWYYHAENQYLEALVDAGWLGLLLVVAAIVLAGHALRRFFLSASDPESFALGIAGLFGLVSQVVQAGFDFGLYLPANAATLAALCGAVSVSSQPRALPAERAGDTRLRGTAGWLRNGPWGKALISAVCVSMIAWSLPAITRDARWDAYTRTYPETDEYQPERAASLDARIASWEAVLERWPDDTAVHQLLARLWTRRYRDRATETLRQQLAAGTPAAQLWEFTSPTILHARVNQLCRDGDEATLQALARQDDLQHDLGRALRHLVMARNQNPVRPDTHLAIAELEPILSPGRDDRPHIAQAVAMAPGEPRILFRAGLLHLQAGRDAVGVPLWQECLRASTAYRDRILAAGPSLVGPVDFFERLFAGLPEPLIEVARDRYGGPPHTVTRHQLADLAARQLAVASPRPPADRQQYLLGRIAWLRDDLDAAQVHLEAAVEQAPRELAYRYELAQVLLANGLPQKARAQALICLRSAPDQYRYRHLLQQIRKASAH